MHKTSNLKYIIWWVLTNVYTCVTKYLLRYRLSPTLQKLFLSSFQQTPRLPSTYGLKISLALWGLLCFHTNCEIFKSSFVKNGNGNLIRIALNLWIAFGSIIIFTILFLPTQEHGTSLHLFVSLISFLSILWYFVK